MPEGLDPTEYRKALGQEMKKQWDYADEKYVKREEENLSDQWEIDRAKNDRKLIGRDPLVKAMQTPEYHVAKLLKRGKHSTNEAGEMVDDISGLTVEQLALKERLYQKMYYESFGDILKFIGELQQKGMPASVFEDEKLKNRARYIMSERTSNIWFSDEGSKEQRDKRDEESHGDLRNVKKFAEVLNIEQEYTNKCVENAVLGFIWNDGSVKEVNKLLTYFPNFDKEDLKNERMQRVVAETIYAAIKKGNFNPHRWVEIVNLVGLEKINIDEEVLKQVIKKSERYDVVALGKLMKADFATLSDETQKQLMLKFGSYIQTQATHENIKDFQAAFSIPDSKVQELLIEIVISRAGWASIDSYIISEIDLKNEENQRHITKALIRLVNEDKLQVVAGLQRQLLENDNFYHNDETLQQLVKEKLVSALKSHQISNADQLKGLLPQKNLEDPEVSGAIKEAFIWILKEYPDSLESHGPHRDFVRSYRLSEETLESKEVQEAVKAALITYLKAGHDGVFFKYLENYGRTESFKQDEELRSAGKACIIKNIDAGHDFNLVNEYFVFTENEIRQCQLQTVIKNLSEGDVGWAREIQTKYKIEGNLEEYKKHGPTVFNSLIDLFEFKTLKDFADFVDKGNKGYTSYLFQTPEQGTSLVKEDLVAVKKANIFFYEAEVLKRNRVDLQGILGDDSFEEYFNLVLNLHSYVDTWKDEQNVMKPFREGAGIFGVEKMLAYMNRPNLSRHDALHAFKDVAMLHRVSGLSSEQFYGNILLQVSKDDASYESGTAHHELNAIAMSLEPDIDGVFQQLKKYQNIPMLQELVETFKSPEDVFKSWKNLKKYNQLVKLLERTEILDQLTELKEQGKDKLYKYVETLAFHPNSQVDMAAVMQFWRDPNRFMGTMDTHTPEEIHNRKKPSNYTEIPNLDLTAEELRDALVEGKIDTLQVFKPMQIEYELARNPSEVKPLSHLVKEALGSRREKIQGKAKNPGKLFGELKRYFGALNVSLDDYLNGKVKNIPVTLEDSIHLALYNPQHGVVKGEVETVKIVAKINLKSDPDGVLAGNDTACCMPFGSGKNNVYTFNPDTSLFTLQIQKADGSLRTIAQSVLTKDRDIGKNIAELLQQMNQVGEHMDKLVSEDILVKTDNTLACDNVEVSPNYKDPQPSRFIEAVYRDFFTEYMRRFGKEQNFDPNHVVVGKGYSDTLTHLPEVNNTYVPAAPVGYSDKTAATVYNLDLTKENLGAGIVSRKIDVKTLPTGGISPKPNVSGVDLLTFEDTLPVAYLEGKAYSSNESLMTYLHNMENGLIAKDINNVAKGRPNMSVKYTDSAGRMRGYILAYEGIKSESEEAEADYNYDSDEDYERPSRPALQGEKVVYISDLASDKEGSIVGGRLVRAFTNLYKVNYIDAGNLIPIFAEAREQTSFRLIQRQLERLSEDVNMKFDLEELPTYKVENDTMHPVMIRPRVQK
jgi:hypothetical protein